MSYRTFLNRLIIFSFLVLIGFSLAKSIQYRSMPGVVLALVSLGATIYFLYLLAKTKEKAESETEEAI